MNAQTRVFPTHDLGGTLIKLLGDAYEEVEKDRSTAKALIARASTLLQVDIDRNAMSSQHAARPGGLTAWQIQRLRRFLDDHLHEAIRVEDLSNVAKLSAAYFSRAFKCSFGMAPHAYIVSQRVQRARHLMLTTDAPLSDIAASCGFTDQAHLCKLFRQSTGQSPATWRRERRSRPKEIRSSRSLMVSADIVSHP